MHEKDTGHDEKQAIEIPTHAFVESTLAEALENTTRSADDDGPPYPGEPSVFRDAMKKASIPATALNATSRFFRNSYLFDYLAEEVLPEQFARKQPLRVWSAGCARGEEPVSIAILLAELLDTATKRTGVRIFATDANVNHVANPNAHRFFSTSLYEVKLGMVEKYFDRDGEVYTVAYSRLPFVHFGVHDLTRSEVPFPSESIFGGFDLVLCRNVLIYYTPTFQECILLNLVKALAPSGYLVLGESEFLPHGERLRTVHDKLRIYQSRRAR